MTPRHLTPADRRADEAILEAGRAVRDAERVRGRKPSSGAAWAELGISPSDKEARGYWLKHDACYGEGAPFSYFRDLARVEVAGRTVLTDDGRAVTRGDVLPPNERDGTLEDARARLATVERRDVTSGDPGTTAFSPTAVPSFVADEFATALRARGVMSNIIRVRPMPDAPGRTVDVPRFATGASAGVQATEGAAVSETDIDGDLVSALKVPISGQSDISIQGYEFAADLDVALAGELGAAVAAALDQQIIAGTGANGQMRGLVNITGVTSVVKTNASPTAATNYAAIGDLVQQTANAYGAMPDTLLMRPVRRAFISSKIGHAPDWIGLTPAIVNSIPTAGSEVILSIPSQEVVLFAQPPRFLVLDEVLSGTLQVRVQAVQIAALVAGRKPAGIGVLSGTEITTAPTF